MRRSLLTATGRPPFVAIMTPSTTSAWGFRADGGLKDVTIPSGSGWSMFWAAELDKWIHIGTGSTQYSVDGETWLSGTGGVFSSVTRRRTTWLPHKSSLMNFGQNGSSFGTWVTSPDGVAWSGGQYSSTVSNFRDAAGGPDNGIVIGFQEHAYLTTTLSPGAKKTGAGDLGIYDNWCVEYIPEKGKFFVGGASTTQAGNVATGATGMGDFTRIDLPALSGGSSVRGLAYSPTLDRFVYVTYIGNIYTSEGEPAVTADFTLRFSNTTPRFTDVKWCTPLNMFIATSDRTTAPLWTSPDGINWTQQPVTGRALFNVATK